MFSKIRWAKFWLTGILVVAAVSFIVQANWPAGEAVKVIPQGVSVTSSASLPPEVQAQEAQSVPHLFDHDTASEYTAFDSSQIFARLEAPAAVESVRFFGPAPYTVNVLANQDGFWNAVDGLQTIDLSTQPLQWNGFAASAAVETAELRFDLTPVAGGGGSGLREIEIWAAGTHVNVTGGEQLHTLLQQTPPVVMQGRGYASAQASGVIGSADGVTPDDPADNAFIISLDYKPDAIKRAWLSYEASGVFHWMGAVRRINGQTARGGYIFNDNSTWVLQTEEISPAWLQAGDNFVEFGTLEGFVHAYSVRNVRIEIELKDGFNFVDGVTGNQSEEINDVETVYDGDFATGWRPYPSGLAIQADQPTVELAFNKATQLDRLSLNVSQSLLGTLKVELLKDGLWQDVGLAAVDVTQFSPGWNDIPVASQATWMGARLTFIGGLGSNATVREIIAEGSGVGGAFDPPAIIVSYPDSGQFYDRTAFIRGFVQPVDNGSGPLALVVAGRPIAHSNGEFEVAVTKDDVGLKARGNSESWSVEINAVYPDGQMVSKLVTLDNLLPSVEAGEVFTPTSKSETVSPGQAKKIVHEEAELDIDATAVAVETIVSIASLREIDLAVMNSGMTNVTKGPRHGYRMLPHGMTFQTPVKVTLPYNKAKLPPGYSIEDIRTFYFDEETGRWMMLDKVALDTVSQELTSSTTHFTDFINAVVTVPDSPQTAQFNPTQIKDIKAANPGAKINLIEAPSANNMGDARLSYPIEVPPGRLGVQPQLGVQYNSSGGNGWLGMGWDLPMQTITIDTRWGVPRYSATEETETYMLNGQQLTPVAHRGALQPRTAEKIFHTRIEGQFLRIVRHGTLPSNYWWEVTDKNGMVSSYGGDAVSNAPVADSTLVDGNGNVFEWALREMRDTNGNTMLYRCVRVADVGVAGGTVPGSALYLKDIFYTGHNGSQGPYRVTFTRDRELLEPRRLDVTIDARGGFKKVTADLLRKVDVSFNGAPVRSYELTYEEGAFHKQLLTAIIQYGEDGLEFNRHTLEYYDEARDAAGDYLGFRPGVTWNAGTDSVNRAFSLGTAEASAISGTSGESFGGHLYVGVGPLTGDKDFSGGVKVGFSASTSDTLLALIDINGDGLPDKVFKDKDSGIVYYRANTSGPLNDPDNTGVDLGATFAAPEIVGDLRKLGEESSSMVSFGPEAYFGASVGTNFARTFNQSPAYFSDVNGDSLPDLVNNGQVLFNSINTDGHPVFTGDSQDTPYPVGGGAVDAAGLIDDYEAIYQENLDRFPLTDTLRRWVAPYPGQIRITGDVALIEDGSDNRREYLTADGVRVAVQHNASELWSTEIGATDYLPKTPVGLESITVAKGDIVYFRVQSVFDGAFDQVSWSPDIQYLFVAPTFDANNLDVYHYNGAGDFILAGFPDIAIGMPYDGTVRIEGELVKSAVTSDDVTVAVLKNGVPVHTQTLSWDQVGSILLLHDVDVLKRVVDADGNLVSEADKISVHVQVDSPIDVTRLSWNNTTNPLRLFYTISPDVTELTDSTGQPLIKIDLFGEMDLYPASNLDAPLQAWVAPVTGPITALPNLATALGDGTTNGSVVVTVKRTSELVAKHVVTIANGTVNNGSFSFNAVAGQRHFFEFSTLDPALSARLPQKEIAVRLSATADPVVVPSEFHNAIVSGLVPQPYRGWNIFGYDGNRERATNPIAISQSDLLPDASFDPATQRLKVITYVPKLLTGRWEGPDSNTWAEASVASSSRNGPDFISVPRPGDFAGARAVARLSSSDQASVSVGVSFLSGAVTTSRSKGIVDFMDMNGDRFPDILGNGGIQYSPMTGGLEASSRPALGGSLRETDGLVANFGVGGNFPLSKTDSKGRQDTDATSGNGAQPDGESTENQMASLGLSASLTAGSSDIDFDLMDINGDGLPDRVNSSGSQIKVAFNLGYGFASEEPWGQAEINHGENDSLSAGGGYNDGIYAWGGGLNFSTSESKSFNSLLDINGDGLLDRVLAGGVTIDPSGVIIGTPDTIKVGFNTGNGFVFSDIDWPAAINQGLSRSKSETLGGGLYFTITIPIPIAGIKIVINPGADVSSSVSRQEVSITDLDGDGYPDYLFSTADNAIQVGRGQIGRTNMLRKVTRPLGATIAMEYQRNGNSFAQPQNRWVMSRVEVDDGFAGDGVDLRVMACEYLDGFFERRERDFYGYRTVVTRDLDHGNGDAVYRSNTQVFHNDSYYRKGLLQLTTTADAAGNKFLETENTYFLRNVGTGLELVDLNDLTATVFPELARTDKRFFEGQPIAGKATHMTYAYDALGNVIRYFDAADTGAADDVESIIGYFSDPANYIVGKANSITVNGNGVEMRRREATIEPVTGNVLQLRRFLSNAQAAVTDLTYDIFGNIATLTGPVNHKGERYALTYNYDTTVNTYAVGILDSFGYNSSAAYNLKYGTAENMTSINGQPIDRTYDTVGRVATVTGPYQAGTSFNTITFAYHPEATVPWALTRHIDTYRDLSDPIETVLFIDGLQHVLQTKKDVAIHQGAGGVVQDRMTVSGRVTFDFVGRIVEHYYPVTEPLGQQGVFNLAFDTVQPTRITFDILDRNTRITIPDNTSTATAYDFGLDRAGQQQFRTTITDANLVKREIFRDVRDLITATNEFNDSGLTIYQTSYAHDPLRQTVEVRDNHNNVTTASYDNFGRRAVIDNQDSGRTEMVFDLASNVVQRVTANLRAASQAIAFDYTFNRLNSIVYPQFPENNVAYNYGLPGASDNRANRIVTVSDESGVEERFYGPLGEVVKSIKTVNSDTQGASANSPEVYTTEFVFDTWNRLQQMTYPDGEILVNTYDSGGLLASASGAKAGFSYHYIDRLEYDKFGDRVFATYGNGVETAYAYNPLDRRLATLQTGGGAGSGGLFQDLSYIYDGVGNILGQTNAAAVSSASQMGGATSFTYSYDDLYRLTHAEGTFDHAPPKQHSYSLDMAYDTIHNIAAKTQSHFIRQPSGALIAQKKTSYDWNEYRYEGAQPHAPTHIGERTFTYDTNGNQTGWTHDRNGTRRTISWDEENRIQAVADNGHTMTYKYNDAGERVIKQGPQGETVYVNQFFTIRNREAGTKHIFAGATRAVSKLMKQPQPDGTPTKNANSPKSPVEKDLYFYHPDHLGSSSYITDARGDLYQHLEYFPFGETWVEESSNTQRTPYLFTAKELDEETGLYYFGARYFDPRTSVWQSPDPVLASYLDGNFRGGVYNPLNLGLYGYAGQNPVKYVDSDGRYIESVWDALSLGLGVVSFVQNVREGNVLAAGLDAGGIVLDAVALALPIIPGGAGVAIKATREGAEMLVEQGAREAAERTARELGEAGAEKAAREAAEEGAEQGGRRGADAAGGSAATKETPDFIVTSDGVAVPNSPTAARESLEQAGLPGRPISNPSGTETGTIHNVPDMKMDIRVMEGGPVHPPRVVTSRQGTSQPVNPATGGNFGNIPRAEQRARSHIPFVTD